MNESIPPSLHWAPDQPYNHLPQLPPNYDLEPADVLKRCVEARSALAELKVSAEYLPNPAVLINTIPLLEAQASSEIENIVTTADSLFRFMELDERADDATREAIRYRHALMEAFSRLDALPICTRMAEQICTRIKSVEMSVRQVPGTELRNRATGEIIYTPPESEERLRQLLANWENFVHGELVPSLDPLVRLAVSHYQFEAIHPFTDGNGRTGRVLNTLVLVEKGLLTTPILYLSRYIIANKPAYYRLLLDVTTKQEWIPWILYILDGITETSRWTLGKIAAIKTLHKATSNHVRQHHPALYDRDVLDLLFEQPYIRISHLVERQISTISTRQSASKRLHGLADADVLQLVTIGREKLFLHDRFLRLLTGDSNNFAPFQVA